MAKHPITNSIHVACAADTAYLPHCAAMLHSLLFRHPDTHVHFLHGPEMEAQTFAPLVTMVEQLGGALHAHCISGERIAGLPRIKLIPALMWYRVFLSELLAEQSRVLYLDADTLVVDDLTELWRTDLGNDYLAAVNNVLPDDGRDWPAYLGINSRQRYFNSGILLLNLDALRADNMANQLIEFGRAQGQTLRWPDQDAFNALMWRRRRVLHPRYNCQNSLFYWPQSAEFFAHGETAEATKNPAILHFEGGHLAKPWHYLNRHPYRKNYFEHRKKTPWPRVKIEGRQPLFILLRPLPTRWTIALLHLFYMARASLRRVSVEKK